MYLYQAYWPQFTWQADRLISHLSFARYEQGWPWKNARTGYQLQTEATLAALTEETVKSSAIEGEELKPESVRSSLARHRGLEAAGARPTDRNVEGVVEMMLDAKQNYVLPLTEKRIFGWHAALFPTGRSGMRKMRTGAWRAGGIEVVSGLKATRKFISRLRPIK